MTTASRQAALITGGGTGVGRATVLALAARGYDVAVNYSRSQGEAEATVARDGRIVFTSTRDGDMDIYSMNADGSDVRRLTNLPGPDGGAFFSADGSKIVFRGRHTPPGKELDDYMTLLKKGLWRPTSLDVFVMNRDGSGLTQVTRDLGGANWAPFFAPALFAPRAPFASRPAFAVSRISLHHSVIGSTTRTSSSK